MLLISRKGGELAGQVTSVQREASGEVVSALDAAVEGRVKDAV